VKVSLNTIVSFNKRYGCADDIAAIGIDKLLDKIDAQLGAIEETVEFGKKYEGIIVAKVISCEPHPGADKLHVCTIDDGGKAKDVERDEKGYVQVVCGAPNVKVGLNVAWIPPGLTVPETLDKEPFVLEARDIRGAVSNGMFASLKELAIGDNHDGIAELDGEITPGTYFAEAMNLQDDIIISLENKMFTHRPDCFGFIGIARELAGIQGLPYKSPDWYVPNPEFPSIEADELKLIVQNELPELVRRFVAVTMANVHVGPSPLWLQIELAKIGQKSINNIVDYTNFFMLETGQPIHVYDYDKVKALSGGDGATLVIRNPKPGETIKLLNGKTIKPRPEAMMVATDKQLICLGGAMGGMETEADEHTKNIIIEAANWDMFNMRRTAMEHGIFTDAVTRFTKGQSPLQNLAVVGKIVEEIRQYADGKVASPLMDDNHLDKAIMARATLHMPVSLTTDFINARLGLTLSADDMKTLLQNVECSVEVNGEELTVTAPFWRTDIELREDVVEEIGRLYGFDKLPLNLPRRDLTPTDKNDLLELKATVRKRLSAAGANEVLTYSFVHGNLLEKVGQDTAQAFQLSNALSPDLQYYRLSLTPSLLERINPNIKAGYGTFALFEIGKTHRLGEEEDGLPIEFERVSLVVAADKKTTRSTYAGPAYYQARIYLLELLDSFGLAEQLRLQPLQAGDSATAYYEPGRAASVSVGDNVIGHIGEYKVSVRQALKLPDFCAGFELDLHPILQQQVPKQYVSLPRFPKVTQDITLKVPNSVRYQQLFDFFQAHLNTTKPDNTLVNLEPIDIYQKQEETDYKQITLRLTIASYERTLTDKEVNRLLDEVAAAAKTELNAERV
jgi:phenylalanyl-tRNA synthetase beta chain